MTPFDRKLRYAGVGGRGAHVAFSISHCPAILVVNSSQVESILAGGL